MFKVCSSCLPQALQHTVMLCKLTDLFPLHSRCSLLLFPTLQTGEDAAVCVSHPSAALFLPRGRITQLSVSLMP